MFFFHNAMIRVYIEYGADSMRVVYEQLLTFAMIKNAIVQMLLTLYVWL